MAVVDQYLLGQTSNITITGTEEKAADLSLQVNTNIGSSTLSGKVVDVASPLTGLSGATVKVFDSNDVPVAHDVTASNGSYSITGLAAGTYKITAAKTGYLLPIALTIIITANLPYTLDIPIVVDPNATLSTIYGIVKDIISHAVIPNVNVQLATTTPTVIPFASTSSNASGEFVIYNVPSGSYTLTLSKPGYTPSTSTLTVGSSSLVNADVQLNQNPSSLNGTISGFITTAAGVAIPAAIVCLYSISGSTETLIATTFTNTSGRYLFGNVAAGTYIVKSKLAVSA